MESSSIYIFMCVFVCVCVCVCVQSLQSSQTLCDSMDCSLPGPSVHGILQARILEWVTMPSSRESSWSRDQTCISASSALQANSLPTETPGKPIYICIHIYIHTHTYIYTHIYIVFPKKSLQQIQYSFVTKSLSNWNRMELHQPNRS